MQLQFADLKKKKQALRSFEALCQQAKMNLTEQKSFADKNGSNSSMVSAHWIVEKLKRIVSSDQFAYCDLTLI